MNRYLVLFLCIISSCKDKKRLTENEKIKISGKIFKSSGLETALVIRRSNEWKLLSEQIVAINTFFQRAMAEICHSRGYFLFCLHNK